MVILYFLSYISSYHLVNSALFSIKNHLNYKKPRLINNSKYISLPPYVAQTA